MLTSPRQVRAHPPRLRRALYAGGFAAIMAVAVLLSPSTSAPASAQYYWGTGCTIFTCRVSPYYDTTDQPTYRYQSGQTTPQYLYPGYGNPTSYYQTGSTYPFSNPYSYYGSPSYLNNYSYNPYSYSYPYSYGYSPYSYGYSPYSSYYSSYYPSYYGGYNPYSSYGNSYYGGYNPYSSYGNSYYGGQYPYSYYPYYTGTSYPFWY